MMKYLLYLFWEMDGGTTYSPVLGLAFMHSGGELLMWWAKTGDFWW
jgi:hypothetical protein